MCICIYICIFSKNNDVLWNKLELKFVDLCRVIEPFMEGLKTEYGASPLYNKLGIIDYLYIKIVVIDFLRSHSKNVIISSR